MSSSDTTGIDYHDASEQTIIDACRSGQYPTIGGSEFGRLVVRIAEDAVVKYGHGVTAVEAATQDFVHSHADADIFRVPKVLRFFEEPSDSGRVGYIVMEYIKGTTFNNLDRRLQSGLSGRLADCLRHLWEIPIPLNSGPGPIDGGEPRGYVWSDDGAGTAFETLSKMGDWLNESLELDEELTKSGRWGIIGSQSAPRRFSLANHSLVMCHGDVTGRNVILQADGTICILDWGYAGYYPRFFDLYMIMCNEISSSQLLTPLLRQFRFLSSALEKELTLLHRVRRANVVCLRFYSLYSGSDYSSTDLIARFPRGEGSLDEFDHCREPFWHENEI